MKKEALGLLAHLLEIPSVNHQDSELEKAEFIASYLQRSGIDARVEQVDDLRGNVIAWIPGRDSSRTMIWNGHIDTVPYGSLADWSTDPAKAVQKGSRLYGRGASDMQSGLAAMMYALAHLKHEPFCNIQFIATCDEEKSGIGAEAICRKHQLAEENQLLLIGEPTGLQLGMAQKGCLWLELEVLGRASHGAYPDEGVNAIEQCMRIADGIRQYVERFEHPLLGRATAQVTKIDGGIVSNITPDKCSAVMDIRLVPGVTDRQVLAEAEVLVQQYAVDFPGLKGSFRIQNTRRAIESPDSDVYVSKLRRLVSQEGRDCQDIGINYFTDASILARDIDMNVLLFGPGDPAMCHKPDEYVDVEDYYAAVRVLMNFLETD